MAVVVLIVLVWDVEVRVVIGVSMHASHKTGHRGLKSRAPRTLLQTRAFFPQSSGSGKPLHTAVAVEVEVDVVVIVDVEVEVLELVTVLVLVPVLVLVLVLVNVDVDVVVLVLVRVLVDVEVDVIVAGTQMPQVTGQSERASRA